MKYSASEVMLKSWVFNYEMNNALCVKKFTDSFTCS